MKKCTECGAQYANDNMNFCPNDGRKLVEVTEPDDKTCRKCGTTNPPDAIYCAECGSKLGEKPAPEPVIVQEGSWLTRFFPIDGVTLGVSTRQEVLQHNASGFGMQFGFIRTGNLVVKITLKQTEAVNPDYAPVEKYGIFNWGPFPQKWVDMGLSQQLGYDSAEKLLKSWGFAVSEKYNNIETKLLKNNKYNGGLTAMAPDGSIILDLYFHDERYNNTNVVYSRQLPGTLYGIEAIYPFDK